MSESNFPDQHRHALDDHHTAVQPHAAHHVRHHHHKTHHQNADHEEPPYRTGREPKTLRHERITRTDQLRDRVNPL
jgi:hypothetical protein